MVEDDTLDHKHWSIHTKTYHDGSRQTDQLCRKQDCPGVARLQMAWAPDTGMNWLKCCCCGDEWNPGVAIHAPGIGELLNRA